jgi:hypothetical protein
MIGGNMDVTVKWAEVIERTVVTWVPDDAPTEQIKVEAAMLAAADAAEARASIVRGTLKWEASDGRFGGQLA